MGMPGLLLKGRFAVTASVHAADGKRLPEVRSQPGPGHSSSRIPSPPGSVVSLWSQDAACGPRTAEARHSRHQGRDVMGNVLRQPDVRSPRSSPGVVTRGDCITTAHPTTSRGNLCRVAATRAALSMPRVCIRGWSQRHLGHACPQTPASGKEGSSPAPAMPL